MKKFLALVLAMLMLASVLVACGPSGDNNGSPSKTDTGNDTVEDPFYGEDNISLLVWAPENAVELTKQLCDDFIALYPDKSITIEVKPQGEGDAAAQVLNDPDVAADVFSFACDQLNRLNKAGALAPVSDDYYDDVVDRNSEASFGAATINDDLLAYPETGDNGYYLVYDKEVVSDDQAKTIEGVFEACRAANRKFIIDAGNGFYSCMFAFTGGLTLEGLDNDVQQFNDYDEDAVLDSLEAFAALFHEYSDVFMSADTARVGSGLAEDPKTVAAGIDGSWNAATVADVLGDNYGAAKLPTININGTDTQIISMHGYKLIGVNARSEFPDAAQVLANYLTDEEAQLARAEQLSWGPSNTAAASSSIVTDNIALSAIIDQSAYSVPQVSIADTFWSPMGALGNKLFKDDNYSRDALKTELEKAIANIKDE